MIVTANKVVLVAVEGGVECLVDVAVDAIQQRERRSGLGLLINDRLCTQLDVLVVDLDVGGDESRNKCVVVLALELIEVVLPVLEDNILDRDDGADVLLVLQCQYDGCVRQSLQRNRIGTAVEIQQRMEKDLDVVVALDQGLGIEVGLDVEGEVQRLVTESVGNNKVTGGLLEANVDGLALGIHVLVKIRNDDLLLLVGSVLVVIANDVEGVLL